jgi:hypothetical protein
LLLEVLRYSPAVENEGQSERSSELVRARAALGSRSRPTVLPDEIGWLEVGSGIERARHVLGALLVRFDLPSDRARVEYERAGGDEEYEDPWTDERVLLAQGFDERPFILWEMSLYVARLVAADVEEDIMIVAVALGLGPLFAGAMRTAGAERGFLGGDPVEDYDLGVLIAEQLHHELASAERFAAALYHLRPAVRRGLEDAHEAITGAPVLDGIPTPLRRAWLEARSSELDERLPHRARWLTPTPLDFPDRFVADIPSVKRIAARLLGHAGLGGREVIVVAFDERTDAFAYFESIDETAVRFGVRADITGDGMFLVSSLAHEVAHAFRRHHGLEVLDLDVEEELTDLTCVALGFGLLMANTTERHTSITSGSLRWTAHAAVGYLEVEDFAWLMAVAARRSGMAPRTLRPLLRHLSARPRDALLSAQRVLEGKSPPSPWTIPVALMLGIALVFGAFGGLVVLQAHPAGGPCADDRDCRGLLGHRCIARHCAVPCADDRGCDTHERCVLVRAPVRFCVPER